jgi:hypothetical protein
LRPRIELVLLIAGFSHLHAQGRDVDFLYGRWYQGGGNQSSSYELRIGGLAAQVLIHDSLGRHRAFYGAGWQFQALRSRSTFGPYAIAGVSLGLSTDTTKQALAALWSVGAGLEWRPISWVALTAEAQYRLEDVGPRGFWRAPRSSHGGINGAVGFLLTIGRRVLRRVAPSHAISGNAGDIVQTALAVLGTPYEWGGTAENGFDCSGLIQYAYAHHGIRLPRTSRDQARSGTLVTPVIEALQPGDILLFSAEPGGGVTHVGMYVGEQTFIHSAATGVKLSRLAPQDPDGAWWLERWVGARRIVQ